MGGAFEVLLSDGVFGVEPALSRHVEQHAAACDRPHGLDTELAEADRGLDALVDVHPSVQRQVLGLVRERIDVRARMLGHDHDAGRTGPRLTRAPRVVAVEEVVEARSVRRVGGRSRVAQLFEVEDAGRLERIEEGGYPHEIGGFALISRGPLNGVNRGSGRRSGLA